MEKIKEPTLKELDEIRKEGFRPGVVACIIHQKKVLMLYKKEYRIWMFPQGGIENKEVPLASLRRNLADDLGEEFMQYIDFSKVLIVDKDRMEFKPGSHEVEELFDDAGNKLQLIGKEYLFCVLNADSNKLKIENTKYDEVFWMSFREAYFVADRMYQKGKRRITLKVLNALENFGLIE